MDSLRRVDQLAKYLLMLIGMANEAQACTPVNCEIKEKSSEAFSAPAIQICRDRRKKY
jgi:hypothetical protein